MLMILRLHLVQVQSVEGFFSPIKEEIWASFSPNLCFSFLFVIFSALKTLCTLEYSQIHLLTPAYITAIMQQLLRTCNAEKSFEKSSLTTRDDMDKPQVCFPAINVYHSFTHRDITIHWLSWYFISHIFLHVTCRKYCSTLRFSILYSNVHTTSFAFMKTLFKILIILRILTNIFTRIRKQQLCRRKKSCHL